MYVCVRACAGVWDRETTVQLERLKSASTAVHFNGLCFLNCFTVFMEGAFYLHDSMAY